MNWSRAHEVFGRTCQIIARCFGGGILCFFAFVPGWILYHGLADIVASPKQLLNATPKDLLLGVGLLVLCAALMYFLLLLAYRAVTFRGRKKDGGLLPPLAMQAFAALFSLGGAGVSAMGIERKEWIPVIGGLIEFLVGVGVFRLSAARKRNRRLQSAPPG